jgi:uncharacterized membrane protein YphA (DoxX/SURF4 family)
MTTAALVARLVLAAVLLAAGVGKARSLRRFSRSVRGVADMAGLRVERPTAVVLAATVLTLELGVAVLLASGFAPAVAAGGGFALATSFAGVSILAIATGRRVQCNCFGRSAAILGPDTLLRAVLLLVPVGIVGAAAAGGTASRWPTSATEWVSSLGLALGALLLLVWASQALLIGRLVRDRRAQPEPRGPRVSGHRPLQELRTI